MNTHIELESLTNTYFENKDNIFLNSNDIINSDTSNDNKIKIHEAYNELKKSHKNLKSLISIYTDTTNPAYSLLKGIGTGIVVGFITDPVMGLATGSLMYLYSGAKDELPKSDEEIFKQSKSKARSLLKYDLKTSQSISTIYNSLNEINNSDILLREKIYATNTSLAKVLHEGITLNIDDPWQRHGLRHTYFKKNNAPTLVKLK